MSLSTPRTDAYEYKADWVVDNYGEPWKPLAFARALEIEMTAECDQLTARAERAEAAETVALANWNGALERALKAEAERDQLRDRLHALTLICGTNDANKFETWIDRANARAERAEAELSTEREKAERYRLTTLKIEAELATERARGEKTRTA